MEVSRLHGPLEICTQIESDDYPYPDQWHQIMKEMDEDMFAILDGAQGKWLIELECKPRTAA